MKLAFEIREYVWDRTRDAPAAIVGCDPLAQPPYSVAEIIGSGPNAHLGRVAHREESELERYVNLILPEEEARYLFELHRERAEGVDEPVDVELNVSRRVEDAMEKRGIKP